MDREENFFDKTPFYMTYPMQNLYQAELEYEKDMERFRSLYPEEVQFILKLIEDRLDELEYEGSRIYDEEPDNQMIKKEIEEIRRKLFDEDEEELMLEKESVPESVRGTSKRSYFDNMPELTLSAASFGGRRNCNSWMCYMVDVLFSDELYRRRCRYRRNRRWW